MPLLYTLVGGYLVVVVLMFVFQRSLMYPASTEQVDLADAGLPGLREVSLTTDDGLRLGHWYKPPIDQAAPVVVVFHGNAGHRGDRVSKFSFLADQGFGLFLMGYRGYGGNPGQPTEAALTSDAGQVLDWLAEQGVVGDRLVLYGESLGTGLAVKFAAARPVAGVILEAPYTSIAAVAQSQYWFLPARYLVLDRWDSVSLVDRISAPILFLHGEQDGVVPVKFGRALFAAAKEPKSALFLADAGHNGLLDRRETVERIVSFVRDLKVPG